MRAVVRRVHPDLFAAHPRERAVNSESLKARCRRLISKDVHSGTLRTFLVCCLIAAGNTIQQYHLALERLVAPFRIMVRQHDAACGSQNWPRRWHRQVYPRAEMLPRLPCPML